MCQTLVQIEKCYFRQKKNWNYNLLMLCLVYKSWKKGEKSSNIGFQDRAIGGPIYIKKGKSNTKNYLRIWNYWNIHIIFLFGSFRRFFFLTAPLSQNVSPPTNSKLLVNDEQDFEENFPLRRSRPTPRKENLFVRVSKFHRHIASLSPNQNQGIVDVWPQEEAAILNFPKIFYKFKLLLGISI